MEATLDTRELEKLVQRLAQSPQILREARRKAFEDAAPKLKKEVTGQLGSSRKVYRWQEAYVGSKGGYAAVRPKARTYAEDDKGRKTRYQVGYVTRAINSGHRFPSPSGRNKRYKPRIKSASQQVPGKHFYQAAQANMPDIARDAAEQVVHTLMEHLQG